MKVGYGKFAAGELESKSIDLERTSDLLQFLAGEGLEHDKSVISGLLWQVEINIREVKLYLDELATLAQTAAGYRFEGDGDKPITPGQPDGR